MTTTAQIIELKNTSIEAYNPFRALLAELKEANEKTVFDYESSKGNKEARSHIHKLRLTKGAVEKTRKELKEDVLERGRRIDGEAKEIIAEVDAMIAVHQAPLDEIEKREEERVASLKARLDRLASYGMVTPSESSAYLSDRLATAEAVVIGDDWQEYLPDAAKAKDFVLTTLKAAIIDAQKREAEAAELERLRKELAERDQKEREERIAREAAERAKAEAEAKALHEKQAAERAANEAKAAAERRELELTLAKERAERQAKEAAENERKRMEAEQERVKAEDAKRAADAAHKEQIHADITAWFLGEGYEAEQATAFCEAARNGEIPHVKIVY